MPISKRDKKVSLTKTTKKNKSRESKEEYVQKVRSNLSEFEHILVIEILNPRNQSLQLIRTELPKSRLYVGKNKLLRLALGRNKSEAALPSTHKLAPLIEGNRALLLTNHSLKQVRKAFSGPLRQTEYAKSGFLPIPYTVRVSGQQHLTPFSHTQEPLLRQLGLDTKLDKGQILLQKDAILCKKGETLTPEQSRLLKLFQQPISEFQIHIRASYEKGEIVKYEETEEASADMETGYDEVTLTAVSTDGAAFFTPTWK